MKNSIVSLLSLLLICGTSCHEIIDIESEKVSIIKVIEEETDAYIKKDYERWAKTYVQDETNVRLSAGKSGFDFIHGWEQLNASFKEQWFEDTTEVEQNYQGIKTNYQIKVYGSSAWALCDEEFVNIETGEKGGTLIESRVLENIDGEWKIVSLSFVNSSSYEEIEEGIIEPETE